MDTATLPHHHPCFTLRRIHPDGSTTLVEGTETDDRTTAIDIGRKLMRERPDAAFTLYEGTAPRDKFGHKTLKLRLKADAIEMIVVGA